MITLNIGAVTLPDGINLLAVDWQVSDDITFATTIAESLDDSTNLSYITFPNELTYNQRYYSRARYKLSTGYTEWSNIFTFLAKDAGVNTLTITIPGLVSSPILTSKFPISYHPPYRFKLSVGDMICDVNAHHVATNWIIEDEYGNVAWMSPDDEENLKEIMVENYLPEDRLYTARASIKASNGDVSVMAGVMFFVMRDTRISLDGILTDVIMNTDYTVQLTAITGLTTLSWRLYKDAVLIDSGSTDTDSFVINGTNFDEDTDYHLAMKVIVNGVDKAMWTYSYIRPIDVTNEVPIGTIPDTDLEETTTSDGFVYDLPADLGN